MHALLTVIEFTLQNGTMFEPILIQNGTMFEPILIQPEIEMSLY
jgi:hypothetical protein